jgi:hypothetical protein
MLRSSPRAIHRGLVALLTRQVLVHDGKQGRARRFRFDLARLAAYRPATLPPASQFAAGTLPPASQFAAPMSATSGRDLTAATLPPVVANSATGDTKVCHPWSGTLPPVAPSDPYERQDPERHSGADAPVTDDRVAGVRINSGNVDRLASRTRRERRPRRPHRIGGTGCPHEPRCSSNTVCIDRTVTEERARRGRRRGVGRAFAATFESPVLAPSRRRAVEAQQPALLFDDPDPNRRVS